MTRLTEAVAREAEIAKLKQLINARKDEPLEMLEEAVDMLLWSEQDRRQNEPEAAEADAGELSGCEEASYGFRQSRGFAGADDRRSDRLSPRSRVLPR